jgi:hypothetical protein
MSSTPHRSVRTWSAALAGAAVLVLVGACGDGGSSAGSRAGSEAAETSAAAGQDEFCSQAAGIEKRVESALSNLADADPSVAEAFQQVAAELRDIQPPDAIASDWEALAAGVDELAAAFDITDSDSLAALEAAEGDLTKASDNVEAYLRDECGIEP